MKGNMASVVVPEGFYGLLCGSSKSSKGGFQAVNYKFVRDVSFSVASIRNHDGFTGIRGSSILKRGKLWLHEQNTVREPTTLHSPKPLNSKPLPIYHYPHIDTQSMHSPICLRSPIFSHKAIKYRPYSTWENKNHRGKAPPGCSWHSFDCLSNIRQFREFGIFVCRCNLAEACLTCCN